MKTRILFSVILCMLIFCSALAQTMIVKGTITDASTGEKLIGVNIQVEGTTVGTVSDVNGAYQISCNPNGCLLFTYLGYLSEKILVNNQAVIDVKMTTDIKKLDEVVVMGYGVQRKCSVTGAVTSVASVNIRGNNVTAMQGKVAGLNVIDTKDESYAKVQENGFKSVGKNPLSTFSIDVDKASYSNIRRFINDGDEPPADAVRIEEMINYFDYEYPQPADEHPFAIFTEMAQCPWQADHKLLHIGIQGKKIATSKLPPSNLVFLIDVSGSMSDENKLPLVKSAFKLLVKNLREKDKVAIVTYAGSTEIVLGSTPGNKKKEIIAAIDNLGAGGSTAGGAGIVMAYQVARENFIKGGNNRVILATDGDFNVGASSDTDMETLIINERKSGVFLSCLGFGMGNYKDSKLETLADKGNGNHAYIDNIQEANKTFGSEFGGTLFTIAKDVKIQVEFNPAKVKGYRLLGYENRLLNDEDFKDDAKDAGELGSGHTVTALYEIIPVGVESEFLKTIPDLKYQKPLEVKKITESDEVATIKMRYKKPDGNKSIELEKVVEDEQKSMEEASDNLKFSSAVAMFGMLLKDSEFKGNATYNEVITLADNARGYDKEGYKAEFVRLVKACADIDEDEKD